MTRKKFIVALVAILSSVACGAQSSESYLGAGAGYSFMNSKTTELFIEKKVSNKDIAGLSASVYFYSPSVKLDLKAHTPYYFGGIFYKRIIYTSRNFGHHFMLGVDAGWKRKQFLYYPNIGLEQEFYLSTNTKFFFAEEVNYVPAFDHKWQPLLKTGLKLRL